MNKKAILYTTLLCFSFITTKAQVNSIAEIEQDLIQSYKSLLNCQLSTSEEKFEKSEQLNEEFTGKIIKHLSEWPTTMQHGFDSLKALNIHIANSEDGKFRIYSWDTWLGGTMRDFRNIFQYKIGDSIYSKLVYDSSGESNTPFYSKIFSINIREQTYYLAVSNGIYSTRDAGQSITAYTTQNGSIQEARVFKESDSLTSNISIFLTSLVL